MLQILGARRTGTNYVEALLKHNFHVEVRREKKHYVWSRYEIEKQVAEHGIQGFILCVKNPYAWLDSMIRWRNKCAHNWKPYSGPDPAIGTAEQGAGYFTEDQIQIWCSYYGCWDTIDKAHFASVPPIFVVRYETLLANLRSVMWELRHGFNLEPKYEPLYTWKDLPGRANVNGGITKQTHDRTYFLEGKYMKSLKDRGVLPFFDRVMRWDIAKLYGYEPAQ